VEFLENPSEVLKNDSERYYYWRAAMSRRDHMNIQTMQAQIQSLSRTLAALVNENRLLRQNNQIRFGFMDSAFTPSPHATRGAGHFGFMANNYDVGLGFRKNINYGFMASDPTVEFERLHRFGFMGSSIVYTPPHESSSKHMGYASRPMLTQRKIDVRYGFQSPPGMATRTMENRFGFN
jgi:hypothetical protein